MLHVLGVQLTGRALFSQRAIDELLLQARWEGVQLCPGVLVAGLERRMRSGSR